MIGVPKEINEKALDGKSQKGQNRPTSFTIKNRRPRKKRNFSFRGISSNLAGKKKDKNSSIFSLPKRGETCTRTEKGEKRRRTTRQK